MKKNKGRDREETSDRAADARSAVCLVKHRLGPLVLHRPGGVACQWSHIPAVSGSPERLSESLLCAAPGEPLSATSPADTSSARITL